MTITCIGTLSRVVTLLECNTDSALVVSDVSHMDEAELEEANHAPIPTASPTSFDILLDDEVSALEVAVLKWTYPDEQEGVGSGGAEGSEELKHLYDDTMEIRAGLGSNEDISATAPDGPSGFGSAGNLSLSQQEERKTGIDHMYVNVQQQQPQQPQQLTAPPPGLSSDDWTDKEKKFLEEDEDAGYVKSKGFTHPLRFVSYKRIWHLPECLMLVDNELAMSLEYVFSVSHLNCFFADMTLWAST